MSNGSPHIGWELRQALTLLGIEDVRRVRLEDLDTVRRRAQRRWHPDRVLHDDPAGERVRLHEAQFKRIEPAVEALRRHLLSQGASGGSTRPAAIHAEFRSVWFGPNRPSLPHEDIELVVDWGCVVRDLLREDLAAGLGRTAVFALGVGACVALLVVLGAALIGVVASDLASLLILSAFAAWTGHALACLCVATPLSRAWTPAWLWRAACEAVDVSAALGESWEVTRFGCIVRAALMTVAAVVNLLVLTPISYALMALVGDARLGRASQTTRFYGGLSEWELDRLLRMDAGRLSPAEGVRLTRCAAAIGLA